LILLSLSLSVNISSNKVGLTESKLLTENVDREFSFIVTPTYQKVQAGETVKIGLSVENIDMGEDRSK